MCYLCCIGANVGSAVICDDDDADYGQDVVPLVGCGVTYGYDVTAVA